MPLTSSLEYFAIVLFLQLWVKRTIDLICCLHKRGLYTRQLQLYNYVAIVTSIYF